MAEAASRIRERATGDGNVLPVVPMVVRCDLQHAEGAVAADFARGLRFAKASLIFAAGADDELTDAAGRVGNSVRVLRSETLVVVIVAVQYNVRAGRVKIIPEILHFRAVAVFIAGTETRHMPKRQRAVGPVLLEVLSQPLFLPRAFAAAADLRALARQLDDVP